MRDGSMFATLNEYDEQSYFDGHPKMYLVTPGGGYIVEIFTAFVAKPSESGSDTFPWRLNWKDDGAYTTWLSEMAGRSVIETDVTVTSSDKVPVSYTHLDVYKRQVRSSRQRMTGISRMTATAKALTRMKPMESRNISPKMILTTGSIRNMRTASKAVLYYFKKARIFHGENNNPLP